MNNIDFDEFLEMFYAPLRFACMLYNDNREKKGDSWNDKTATSIEYLQQRLMKKLGEYFGTGKSKYRESCDALNLILMITQRELNKSKEMINVE